jgi:hypothetical protein
MKYGMIFAAAPAARMRVCDTSHRAGRARTYRIALPGGAGQQVALLKWMARQDKAAQAGTARGRSMSTSGDSWDYLVINPVTTKAQDDAVDAAVRKMGIIGTARRHRIRTIASHTDTTSSGPQTAAQMQLPSAKNSFG